MLFRSHILGGIAEGRVTLAFRRWRRPPPAVGSTLRSPVGVLSIDHVAVVEEDDITADDIGRTGMSREELRASIEGTGVSSESSSGSSVLTLGSRSGRICPDRRTLTRWPPGCSGSTPRAGNRGRSVICD
jgi:hypothetical protein